MIYLWGTGASVWRLLATVSPSTKCHHQFMLRISATIRLKDEQGCIKLPIVFEITTCVLNRYLTWYNTVEIMRLNLKADTKANATEL